MTNCRSTWPPPRRLRSSLTSTCQVVFPRRPPNTRRWLVRAMNGDHLSSISARPRQHPTSLPRKRSPGNLLINIPVLPSTIGRVLPHIKLASTLKVASLLDHPPLPRPVNPPAGINMVPDLLSTVVPLTIQAIVLSTKAALNPLLDPREDIFPPATMELDTILA